MTQFSLHPVAFRRITEASKNSKTELKLYDSLRMRTIALAVVWACFGFCGFCHADPLATWNPVFSNSPVQINSMAYGNGTFVGVGEGMRFISHDGSNWTVYVNSPILKQAGIAYGNGVFLTFGTNSQSNSTYIYQSTNGLNWTPIHTNTYSLFAAAFGNNTWVFVGTNYIVTATVTASNWNWSELQPVFAPTCIAYLNGNFLINSILNGYSVFSSSDGLTWQYKSTLPNIPSFAASPQYLTGVAYNSNVYVCTAQYFNKEIYYSSSNLVNWQTNLAYSIAPYSFYNPIVYAGGEFVLSFGNSIITLQNDGQTWINDNFFTNYLSPGSGFNTLTVGQGRCVACASNMIFQSGAFTTQSNLPATTLSISTYPGVTINGTAGLTYQIQSTTSLNTNWVTLTNFSLPYSPYLWIDTSTTVTGQRFYRSVQLQ